MVVVTPAGELDFMIGKGDAPGAGDCASIGIDYRDGRWHHMQVVRQGSSQSLYVDDVLREVGSRCVLT